MIRTSLRAILLGAIIALAGCQTPLPAPDEEQPWLRAGKSPGQEPFVAGDRQANWEYAAKVGLVINGDAEQANLVWLNSGTANDQTFNRIRLFGPLGTGAVKLEYDTSKVLLTDNKGREYSGRDPEKLLTKVVGWPLPVNALSYWLFATPQPGAVYEYQINEVGQISALRQRGWTIHYSDWRDYDGRQLPRKIAASKTFKDRRLGDVAVKLISKSWQWQ